MIAPADVLAYIDWVWGLEWRAALDLSAGDASWNEIAHAIGVDAPVLQVGDTLPDELGTAQLYWPDVRPVIYGATDGSASTPGLNWHRR